MADRMIVMNAGVAEQIGTPLEVYERPQSLFAGQFIGSPAMNILDGHVEKTRITLNCGASFYYQTDHEGAVKVGIRPYKNLDLTLNIYICSIPIRGYG